MPIDPSVQPDATPEPILPSSLPPTATPPLSSGTGLPVTPIAAGTTGLEPNIAAGLSTLFTLVTGIIFLLIEKRDAYVRFWAMQSVVFGATWMVAGVVFAVIHAVLSSIFWLLGGLWFLFTAVVWLGFLMVWIIMIIQAFSGKEWEIPVLGKIARQQLARYPTIGL